ACGLAPPLLSASTIDRWSRTSSGRPTCSASAIAGTSPASLTRFASSNATSTTFAAYNDCIGRVHLDRVDGILRKNHHPRSQGTRPVTPHPRTNLTRWIRAERRRDAGKHDEHVHQGRDAG